MTMKLTKTILLGMLFLLFAIVTSAQNKQNFKQSNIRPAKLDRTAKPFPPRPSINTIIEQAETKLEYMKANPDRYSANDIATVEAKLAKYCNKRDSEIKEPASGEITSDWVEITEAEAKKLPKETEKKVKAYLDAETGEKAVKIYKKKTQD